MVKRLAAILAVLGVGLGVGAYLQYHHSSERTISELMGENRELNEAIGNLTAETQIGFAKVLTQGERDGKLYTRILFVETHRADPSRRVLEREYEVEGDVVHFDALIVRFGAGAVKAGQERAIYLWRRIYGEKMRPQEGYAIEAAGTEPQRYADICQRLSLKDRQLFWEEIWGLANDPKRLQHLGITAIYGNVVYHRLRAGLQYNFKIKATGELYPEAVPDL